jgi:hypothetical protein
MRHARNRAVLALFGIALVVCMGCAAAKPPAVLIQPPPKLPTYTFSDTGCLDAAGLAAYDREQELIYSRLEYFHKLLLDLGAKDAPKPLP